VQCALLAIAFLTLTAQGQPPGDLSKPPGGPSFAPKPPDIAKQAKKFGPPRKTLTGHANDIRSMAVSPHGKRLATGSHEGAFKEKNITGVIRLWNLPDGTGRITLKGHADVVLALAFTPDGKQLISGSIGYDERRRTSGEIKVWDVSTGTQVRTLR